MSYSSKVKEELIRVIPEVRHCLIGELAAIISSLGNVKISEEGKCRLVVRTEHPGLARKYFTLLKKTFNIGSDVVISDNAFPGRKHTYSVNIRSNEETKAVLLETKILATDSDLPDRLSVKENIILQSSCCKKAFLRGSFLAAGSITDPEKSYHMEVVFAHVEQALQLRNVMEALGLSPKIIRRKRFFVVYLKESDQIVMALGFMDAPRSFMELENVRILKGMRNDVNRKVNCETANINKTVSAAFSQLEDINLISTVVGLNSLTANLRAVAEARLENPEATLAELGEMISPALGKSGVNHRLRRLSEIANRLRESRREEDD